MHRRRFPAILFCIAAIVSLFFSLPNRRAPGHLTLVGEADSYTAALLERLPGYQLQTTHLQKPPNLYAGLPRGDLSVCLDVQAVPALRHGLADHFLPQYLSTVVLAVDRDRTEQAISGWTDLENCGVSVSLPENDPEERAVLAAVAYAMGGEACPKGPALHYLERLNRKAGLSYAEKDCAVMICFDSRAAQLRKQGRNIEIIVPREGTLSFAVGLLSDHPVTGLSGPELLRAGLRLPDGQCDASLYPQPRAYDAAVPVPDPDRFVALTRNHARDLRRQVFHTHIISSADGREHIMVFLGAIMIILLWAASALHRSPQARIRKWIWSVAGICIGWLLTGLLKFQLPSNLLNRMCWYAYYVFLLALPLLLLSIAAVFDRPPELRQTPRWLRPVALCYPPLVLLVLTNDFHQLVFRFDLSGNWSGDYHYQGGYFLIFAYCIAVFLFSIGMLLVKSRKSPKPYACVGPLLAALLLIGYNVGYVLGISLVRSTNLSLFFCLLSVLFMESVFRAGIIPTNTHYADLFSSSALNVQLLDEDGNTVLASADAAVLKSSLRSQICACPGYSPYQDKDTLVHSCPICGGITVWQEDLSVLNRLQRESAASVRKMQAANTLLQKERMIQQEKITSDVRQELIDLLEADIAEKSADLSEAIRTLPTARAEREQRLSYIVLLLCHIKRRSNLFFVARQGPQMAGVELAVYLDELSEFAACSGVRALVRCADLDTVEVKTATLFYDFYFSFLSWSLLNSHATLIGQLECKQDLLCFHILSSDSMDSLHFSESFLACADRLGARITRRSLEDSEGITLQCPRKGADGP